MAISSIKSVPADLHVAITKSHEDDKLSDLDRKRFIELIEAHGVENIHDCMTPLYLAVTMGKVSEALD